MAAAPPPKPWEAKGAVSSSSPGAPKPWEQAGSATDTSSSILSRPAERPWERTADQAAGLTASTSAWNTTNNTSSYYNRPGGMYGSSYGAGGGMYGNNYGSSNGTYGSGYGSGMYGSSYGSGMYGNNYLNRGGMYGGGGMYGSSGMYGGGMYGNSMYGSSNGMYGTGGMYGSGMGMAGGPGMQGMDPYQPPPAAPPNAWQTLLAGINGIMHFFGRLSFLVDENAHAVHFFISALLQLLDRAGYLYAELARFILRILFRRRRAKTAAGGQQKQQSQQLMLPGPANSPRVDLPNTPTTVQGSVKPTGLIEGSNRALDQAAASVVPAWATGSGQAIRRTSAVPWGPAGRAAPEPLASAAVGSSAASGWDNFWSH